jgi:hypothetical protein
MVFFEEKLMDDDRAEDRKHVLRIDGSGLITTMAGLGYEYSPSISLFELDGEIAGTERVSESTLRLTNEKASRTLAVKDGEKLSFRIEGESEDAAATSAIVLSYPLDAEFHLPGSRSTGRTIDRDMPLGETYSGSLAYNFLLIRLEKGWIRFMIENPQLRKLRFEISRHPAHFLSTVTWPFGDQLNVEFFRSLEAALDNFRVYLRKRCHVTPLREDKRLPSWVHGVKLIFTLDMLRSHGEICHDYSDVAALAEDLAGAGCPKNTLFYLPGWNADYDAGYPTYRPHSDLGGETKFRSMIETLHGNGFRVMVHTNPWGIDPSHPEFAGFKDLLQTKEDGSPKGWQIDQEGLPPSAALKFRTGKVSFPQEPSKRRFSFETVDVLDYCEAVITMGSVALGTKGTRVSIGRRSFVIPPDGIGEEGEYTFPYAFMLAPGKNRIEVEVLGEPKERKEKGWYRIVRCYRYPDPYAPWTYPIQVADTSSSGWIELFVGEIERAVREYGIDAVHLDAATHDRPRDNGKLFRALKERIPGVPIGGEWCSAIEDLGYWTFCQGATQSLIANTENARRTRDCNSIPPRGGLGELYAWLGKPSPVCTFATDYMYSYLHLCAADAFVPVGKVCNVLPERKMPPDSRELWEVLRNAPRYGAIPNLRANYRKYGLDDETRKAVGEIASGFSTAR